MSINLESLSDAFLSYLFEVRGYAELTVTTYEIALRQMRQTTQIEQEEGGYFLDLTPFRLFIKENTKRTIAKKLSAIHSFIHYLEKQHHITIRLYADEPLKVPKTLPKPLDEAIIQEVLEEANLEEKLLLMMLYGLGLRISEVAELPLLAIGSEWIRVRGKGNKQRELPLLESLREILDVYLASFQPQKYLFEKGKSPLNTAQLRYKLTKLFARVGVKATPHQLRHSFATHLLHHGARIADVSELLGHSTMATTQIYTQLQGSKKMQAYMEAHPLAQESYKT